MIDKETDKHERIPYLASLGTAAALTGCSKTSDGTPDLNMEPVGDGLSFIGVCFVVGVLVLIIGISRK